MSRMTPPDSSERGRQLQLQKVSVPPDDSSGITWYYRLVPPDPPERMTAGERIKKLSKLPPDFERMTAGDRIKTLLKLPLDFPLTVHPSISILLEIEPDFEKLIECFLEMTETDRVTVGKLLSRFTGKSESERMTMKQVILACKARGQWYVPIEKNNIKKEPGRKKKQQTTKREAAKVPKTKVVQDLNISEKKINPNGDTIPPQPQPVHPNPVAQLILNVSV